MKIKTKSFLRIFAVFLAAVVGAFALSGAVSAFASADPNSRGSPVNGLCITNEISPAVISSADYHFTVEDFPLTYYDTLADLALCKSSVTAGYNIYNPTRSDITLNIAYPFIKLPSYAYNSTYQNDYKVSALSALHSATVGGKEAEVELRATLSVYYDYLDLYDDLARLMQSGERNALFAPTTPVTCYSYSVTLPDSYGTRYGEIEAPFPSFDSSVTALIFPAHRLDENANLGLSVLNGQSFNVYAVGQAIDPISWSGEDGVVCTLAGQSQTTVYDLFMSEYALSEISQSDWFNIVCDYVERSRRTVAGGGEFYNIESLSVGLGDLQLWYTYQVQIPAGGTVQTAVKSPVWPDIRDEGEFYDYTFNAPYVGDNDYSVPVNITVNSTHFVNYCPVGEFTRDGDEYTLSTSVMAGRDDSISFIMSDTNAPFVDGIPPRDPYENLGAYIALGLIIAGVVAAAVFLIVRAVKKRKNPPQQ